MRAEGLVDVSIQRHEVGRPSYVYRLTERAEEMSAHYPRLVDRMFKRLATLPADRPVTGQQVMAQVFEGVADDIAGAYRPLVTGATVGRARRRDERRAQGRGHRRPLAQGRRRLPPDEHGLPVPEGGARRRTRPATPTTMSSRLLVGAPVEQVSRIVDGHSSVCEYVVREIAAHDRRIEQRRRAARRASDATGTGEAARRGQMADELLKISGLTVAVEGKQILNGVDLTVNRGEVHAIMGPNGSGKSTLANALMGHPRYQVTRRHACASRARTSSGCRRTSARSAGMFLAFQYPTSIPGVTMVNFLRQAHEGRARRGRPRPRVPREAARAR